MLFEYTQRTQLILHTNIYLTKSFIKDLSTRLKEEKLHFTCRAFVNF